MGFFTTRERAELGKSTEASKSTEATVQKIAREPVRRDFAPRRQAVAPDLTGHVGVLMQGVTEKCLQEIDRLVAVLRQRREQLLAESARMQREIIAFASLNQSTMQSTRIISENLAHFVKVPDAPRLAAFGEDSDAAPRDGGAAASVPFSEDGSATGGRAEASEAVGDPRPDLA
jgi:hypothetical protein